MGRALADKIYSSSLSWPQSAITTFWLTAPLLEPTRSIRRTTSMPSATLPKTTWAPFSQGVGAVVMKNCGLGWEPARKKRTTAKHRIDQMMQHFADTFRESLELRTTDLRAVGVPPSVSHTHCAA